MENKVYPSKEKVTFLFCEDVRMEIGNKQSLMGWFSNNDIVFSSKMEKLITPLAIICRFQDGSGSFKSKFEVETPKGEIKISQELGKQQKSPESAMLVINKFNQLNFEEEGVYHFRIFLDDKKYEESLKVIKAKEVAN